MAEKKDSIKHPYTSSTSALNQMLTQLRRAFPAQLSSETLKKLAIAPNNESHVLNILRFLKIIDSEGNKNAAAAKVFAQHADEDFQAGFTDIVRDAYADLFSLHGDAMWGLNSDRLISFFRSSDHTSDLVGRRQTTTFQALALFAGKLDAPPVAARTASPKGKKAERKAPARTAATTANSTSEAPALVQNVEQARGSGGGTSDVGLTVRIEINLPAGGDQETYDNIFRSIRENLLNGKVG